LIWVLLWCAITALGCVALERMADGPGHQPDEFAAQIRADLDRYATVVKTAKITADS
jgi:hypothetical protein